MLSDQARSAFRIAAGTPGARLDQYVDPACGRHAEKSKAQEPTKFARAWIVLATRAARGGAYREPDFVAGCRPIDPLKHEFKVEAKLQFTDDNNGRLAVAERNEIATADLALHVEPEGLEKALHGEVKRCLPRCVLWTSDLLMGHWCTVGVENRLGRLLPLGKCIVNTRPRGRRDSCH